MELNLLREIINSKLIEREAEMLEIRRHLHANPELSFEEKETSEFIAKFYQGKDCKLRTNVGGGYGIIVDIEGGKPGKNLALRGDMDALPVEEAADLDFKSKKKGVMHACGHDVHTAYLMILADILIEMRHEIPGNIRIIHQPAEEKFPGGALGMIEAGCLDGMDAIMAAHVMTSMNLGEIAYREGPVQTGRANFTVELEGVGGHAAAPHEANDTIVAACQFVSALQTIVSRRLNPFDAATVTIGSFDGAGSANIIKHTVTLKGDIRMMQEENRDLIETEFRRILDGIATAFNLKYKLDYQNDYIVLVNDENLTQTLVEGLEDYKIDNVNRIYRCEPQSPSEDFSYYADKIPGCFFYVGATREGDPFFPHHHPNFCLDEESILIMARAVANGALYYLYK